MRAIAGAMSVVFVIGTPLQAWAQLSASQKAMRAAAVRLGADRDGDEPDGEPRGSAPPSNAAPPSEHAVLPVPLVPARVEWDAPHAGDPWVLFDGHANTGLTLSESAPVSVAVTLTGATELGAATVLGPAHGKLTIQSADGSTRQQLRGWQDVELDLKEGQWKRITAAPGQRAQRLVVTWASDEASGPNEIGFWGFDAPSRDAADLELADRILSGPAAGTLTAKATPDEGHVSRVELGAGAPLGPSPAAVFTAHLASDPRSLSRAFLVYELTGLGHWTEAVRQINGLEVQGGSRPAAADDRPGEGGLQVEEIATDWLRPGDNEVRFLPPTSPGVAGYAVRHVRLVGIGHANVVETRLESGARLDFGLPSQPHELAFDLLRPSEGQLLVDPRARHHKPLRVDLHGLEPGWHRIGLDDLPSTDALGIALSLSRAKQTLKKGHSEDGSTVLSEVAATASPREPRDGRLVVSYPLHGECVEHAAHVRGFVGVPAGDEVRALRAQGRPFDVARDGSFSLDAPEPESARGRTWEVPLEAELRSGTLLRTRLLMQPCLDRSQDEGLKEDEGAPFSQVVRADQPTTISFADARLEIPSGAVDRDVRISIRPLVADQVPHMSTGVANVSPSGGAFRLGPHGLKFKKPIKITLPYDAHALSRGAHERQIFTFFYDEHQGKWTRIGRYGTAQDGSLTSLTEHFTDFVNATLAMPDESAPQSFDPNEMKGIKLADPGMGLDLIATPTANSRGTADLTYPIEVPPGRNGVEPKLAFTYDSAAGNGWLGMGWDLHVSSIQIDTRFGVPQYTGNETYQLDGGLLTPSGGNLYSRRVEGRFDKIQRNQSGSCVASWTVTDKSGTVYQYGGPGATLADPNTPCNAFQWFLSSVTDTYGNGMTVTYFADSGKNGDTWVELYPQTINYTTSTKGAGLAVYQVSFVLDRSAPRPDVIISGRPGFERLTRYRLDHVDVSYQGTAIRSYKVGYKADSLANFHKSLVETIGMFGVNGLAGTELDQHSFEYNTNALTGSGGLNAFGSPQQWGQVQTAAQTGNFDDGLSKTAEQNAGAGGSVGIGFPGLSASVNAGGNSGSNDTHLSLFDVNGDSLPDVLDDSGHASFNFLNPTLSVPSPTAGALQYANVGGLPQNPLNHTSTSGWNVGVTGSAGILTAGVGYTRSSNDDQKIVADVDGDGFSDLAQVSGGQFTWYRNDGTGHFGSPSMSQLPGNLVAIPGDTQYVQDQVTKGLRRIAPLERWTAPFDGTVTVFAPIAKNLPGGNGVVASIYQNGTQLWQRTIMPDDLTTCIPTPPGGCGGTTGFPVTVSAGDRIYLTVEPFDDGSGNVAEIASESQHNDVSWNPTITYQVFAPLSLREPNGPLMFQFSQAQDFALAGRPSVAWSAPADGKVVITGDFMKFSTSDGVQLNITQNGTSIAGFPTTLSDGSATFALGAGIPLSVKSQDQIQVQVTADSPIDPLQLQWAPQVTYTNYCKLDDQNDKNVCGDVQFPCGPNGCTFAGDPSPDLLIPLAVITQQLQVFVPAEPLQPLFNTPTYVVPSAGNVAVTGSVTIAPQNATGNAFVLVQGVDRLFSKQSVPLAAGGTVNINTNVSAQANDQIFVTVFAEVPLVVTGSVQANGASLGLNVRWTDPLYNANSPIPVDPMSGGFHGWSTGFINGELPFAESNIVFPTDAHGNPVQAVPSFTYGEPVAQGTPKVHAPLWAGPADDSYITRGQMGTTRGSFSGGADGGGSGSLNALRSSTTWNVDGQLGVSFGVSVSGSVSGGEGFTSVDFFDFNGDRYPDSITTQGVALGDGKGNFSAPLSISLPSAANGALRHSDIRGENASAGVGSSPIPLTNRTDTRGRPLDTLTLGFGIGENYSMSMANVEWADVNGDGLPDVVTRPYDDPSHFSVSLNYGYRLGPPISWSTSAWNTQDLGGSSALRTVLQATTLGLDDPGKITVDQVRVYDSGGNNASGTVGVTVGNVGGGVSAGVAYGIGRTLVDLVDINGDGLPDQVMKDPNNSQLLVKMNLGSQFDSNELPWNLPDWTLLPATGADQTLSGNLLAGGSSAADPNSVLDYRRSRNYNVAINFQVCFFVCVGANAYYSWGNGWQHSTFEDVDGDGSVDQVMKVSGQGTGRDQLYAKLNQTATTNLLTVVHRPLGGNIRLTYSRAGNLVRPDLSPPVDMPTNKWVMTGVDTDDGVGNHYVRTISYDPSGFHDRVEREDYGFAKTTTRQEDGSTVESDFFNHDFYRRGLLSQSTVRDQSGNLFDVGSAVYADPTLLSPPPAPLTGTFFPSESARTTSRYEGTSANLSSPNVSTTQTRIWDAVGNLTDMTDTGDVGLANDVHYHVTFDPGLAAQYIFRPSEITAQDHAGNVLRDRTATYDRFGGLATLTNLVTGGTDGSGNRYANTAATWTYGRDSYGNITSAVDPRGYTVSIAYDTVAQVFVVQKTDSFGYSSSSVPNYLFGSPASTTDLNGNMEVRTYDDFGRLRFVYGPNDIGASEPTIAFVYSEQGIGQDPLPAFAETDHKDVQHPGNPIATVSFADGLGRVIQTKKDLEKDTGTGTIAGMSVSGALTFDSRGRVHQRGQPVFDTGPTQSFVSVPMNNPTTMGYDILDRPTSTQTPDAALTTVAYGLDTLNGTLRLATTVKDANVNAGGTLPGAPVETFKDVRGSTVSVKQSNRFDGVHPTTLVTSYGYDPLEELLSVTDASGNLTTAQYDTLGRMVSLSSPDAGLTTYAHDLSGNMVARQTAKLRANGQSISYQYDFNRLRQITYPTSPPVAYFYGDPTEMGSGGFNRAGRIKEEDSEAGIKTYQYDMLGNVVVEQWTLNSIKQAPDQTYSQSIGYAFDSFGRMLNIFFRDGETVSYGYDLGGNVTTAVGVDAKGNTTQYLSHLGYDEFEQRERLVSGNRVTTTYAYDPLTRRPTQINASERDPLLVQAKAPARPFQKIRYTYDLVGNITQVQNLAPFDDTLKGTILVGPKTENFAYDDLYQLKTADGVYQESSTQKFTYGQSFTYDTIGNVLQKQQTSYLVKLNVGGKQQPETETEQTYSSVYKYAGPRPHAPTEVDETDPSPPMPLPRTLSYDPSGNQTGRVTATDTRTVTFDEEDRITAVVDNTKGSMRAIYDGAGDRAVKLNETGGNEETAYFGPNLTSRDGSPPTKHIFAGTQRIASKLAPDDVGNQTPPTMFYFHDDHLGSTNFLTDATQTLSAHEEYFPTGELWVDETSDPLHVEVPYLFTGKELDAETGLYYFGARYYDPHLSMWASPDPLLARYIQDKTRPAGLPTSMAETPRAQALKDPVSPEAPSRFAWGESAPANHALDASWWNVYTYAANNPVIYVDSDGRKIVFAPGSSDQFKAEYKIAVAYLRAHNASFVIDELEARPETIMLEQYSTGSHRNKFIKAPGTPSANGVAGSIIWDPFRAEKATATRGGVRSPANVLSHEADHAVDFVRDPEGHIKREQAPMSPADKDRWGTLEEKRVIEGSETTVAQRLREAVRTQHWSQGYDVAHSNSTTPK
jgi:RHS repeat-associated protein